MATTTAVKGFEGALLSVETLVVSRSRGGFTAAVSLWSRFLHLESELQGEDWWPVTGQLGLLVAHHTHRRRGILTLTDQTRPWAGQTGRYCGFAAVIEFIRPETLVTHRTCQVTLTARSCRGAPSFTVTTCYSQSGAFIKILAALQS